MSTFKITLSSVNLRNFKNVRNGTVSFLNKEEKLPVLGIYGQNGSGKTALVEVFSIFKTLVAGRELGDGMLDLISKDTDSAHAKFVFIFKADDITDTISYEFSLKINEENLNIRKIIVSSEKITIKRNETPLKTVALYDRDAEPFLSIPHAKSAVNQYIIDFSIPHRISDHTENTSFLFRHDLVEVFKNEPFISQNYCLNQLRTAAAKLFVINNAQAGAIYADIALNIPFGIFNSEKLITGELPIPLYKTTTVDDRELKILRYALDQINFVLDKIIIGLQIKIKEHDQKVRESDNIILYEISLQSHRKDVILPLSQESDGIKKIISFLCAFTCAYGDENAIVVVDELDSGIFEYLLGELVEVFADNAKGQLIFTSHNLRVLEVLDRRMVVFSTTNENQRYITLKGIKQTHNLRDTYIREMALNSQKELLYEGATTYDLRRALDKASKLPVDFEDLWNE